VPNEVTLILAKDVAFLLSYFSFMQFPELGAV
jgi:hypothetical protein